MITKSKKQYTSKIDSLFQTMFPRDNQELSYFYKKSLITEELKKQYQKRIEDQYDTAFKAEEKQNKYLQEQYVPNGRKKYLDSINIDKEEYSEQTKRNLAIFKNCEEVVSEEEDDSIIKLEYTNIKYMKKFGHDIKQSILVNKTEARDMEYDASFFTNTLLSRFQPFRTTGKRGKKLPFDKWTVNPNFIYASLDEAIKEGYIYLNSFLTKFIHNIKNYSKKNRDLAKLIKYNIVLEPHKTLQVHCHGIIFHHPSLGHYIKKMFERTLKEYNMPSDTNDLKQDLMGGVDGATKYIIKYIQKNLQVADSIGDEEYKHDWYDEKKKDINIYLGWKMMLGNPAKIHRGSRNKLDKRTTKLIYRVCSDAEGYKSATLQQATKNGTCMRYEIMKDTAKRTVILEENQYFVKDPNDNKSKVYNMVESKDINGNDIIDLQLAEDGFKIKDYQVEDKDNKRFHVLEVKRKLYKKRHGYRKIGTIDDEPKITTIPINKEEYLAKKQLINKSNLTEGLDKFINNEITNAKIKTIKSEILKIEQSNEGLTMILFDKDHSDPYIFSDVKFEIEQSTNCNELIFEKKSDIKRLEKTIEEDYIKGYNVQLIEIKKQIFQLINIPEELMLANEMFYLSTLFKLESEIKRKINRLNRLYFVYYKVEELIITDMGEKILYDKNWYTI